MIIYSRTALAQDSHGNLTRLTTIGPHQDEVKTSDTKSQEYLSEILNQLRVLNFHLSVVTEVDIEEIGD